ncbi:hypothetical protein GL50803_0015490 [Giardia duodenalis]|uniref:Uncharacterized protein n=1 Tax=Giardia intestinalis (strain ATCC 50803 / WB clone C6) TaxID=184922 RepID=A0A644F174_GIAIC|nr:hypothetical protein GL50803_0015490 [Giardia intestinalis]KAE8302388.1 hypothetical protein GL50803_0015490 [Giardia intestinalis]
MLTRLRLEAASFARRVEQKFNLAQKQEELRAARQREFILYEFYCLLTQRESFNKLLSGVVQQQYDHSQESQFGLGELALPTGTDINPMPIFRFKALLSQLERATSREDIRKVFKQANERSLFCGAEHVREILILMDRKDLREEVWRICAPYIPEKECLSRVIEILPVSEQRSLKNIYWPPR